jgi:hypothetical protein
MPYRTLDPDRIVKTLDQLQARIDERFPGRGLGKLCGELVDVARTTKARAERIAAPNLWLRFGSIAVIMVGVALASYVGLIIEYKHSTDNLFGVVQGIEALMNVLVLSGAAIFFLSTIEQRWKRHQALEHLHELRTIVHVIDMHQLTKDPSRAGGAPTRSSPSETLTPFELKRYLDYCSEMLSLAAKVATLYAQSSRDGVVISAVTELEQISANLSHKIWQKITLIRVVEEPVAVADAAVAAERVGSAETDREPMPGLAVSVPAG